MVWASLLVVLVSFLEPQTQGRRPTSPREAAAPPAYLRAIASRDDQANKARIVLRSGAVVLVEEQAADPLIVVQSTFQTGTADETAENRGAAALLARLLLRSGFAEAVQKASGTPRVETRSYATTFTCIVPAENLAKVLALHADLLTFPAKLTEESLTRERQLVREERARVPDPLEAAQRRVPGESLPEGAAADQTDLTKIRAFHQRNYKKSNMVLVIVGGVIREQLLEKVVELYGKGRATPEEKKLPADVTPGGFAYAFSQGKVSQPYVFLRYRAPARSHPDFYPFLLVAYALGEGRGSVLEGSVVQRQEQAALAEGRIIDSLDGSSVLITLVPSTGGIDAAEISALAHIELVRRNGLNEDQLEGAKALFLADHFTNLAGMEARAEALSLYELMGKGLERDAIPARVAAIRIEDARRAASRYLDHANLSVLELVPESAEARTFTQQSFEEMLQAVLPGAVGKITETKELAIRTEGPSIAPALSFKPKYLKYGLKKTSVVRGPDVYYQEDHSSPLVHLGVFYPGGRFQETPGKLGITEVMLRALMRTGLRKKGTAAPGDLDEIGAKIGFVNEPDFFGFQASVLSNHLEPLLRTLIEWIRQVKIEEADVNHARSATLALLNREQDQALVNCSALVWKDHPYGRSRYGAAEDLGNLDLSAIEEWRTAHMGQTHPLILLRGDVQGTSFLEGFVTTLSDRRLKPAVVPSEEEQQEEEAKPVRATEGSAESGLVVFAGPPQNSRDESILHVIQSALGGAGGLLADQLWAKLGVALPREFSHFAYLRGGTVVLRFDAPSAKREEGRQEVVKALTGLKTQPLRRDQFLAGISRSITQFYSERQNVELSIRQLGLYVFGGGGVDFDTAFIASVKELQPEDLQSFAEEFFVEGKGSP